MNAHNDAERGMQWGVKVPLSGAEPLRRKLISDGLYDGRFRPYSENGFLFIPVLEGTNGAELHEFVKNPERAVLARHEQVGGLVILQENNMEEAEKILKNRPNVHTVLYATSPVEGEFRTRSFTVLAGCDTTETVYTEYGKKMVIDLSLAYFSARLSNERRELLSQMRGGERVLDMFAGVGPFAVSLSGRCSLMVANDLNPNAVYLMQKNLRLNKIRNVVPVCGNAINLPNMLPDLKFDRIIMNLPFTAYEFLEAAAKLAAPHCRIHLYSLVEREGEHLEDISRAFPGASVTGRYIRSYSPDSWHAVYDIVTGEEGKYK
ncbi:MAG TPA: methyltransferase [Methanocorpusculum sp.]|nr:methyltransferase [Methanocorpusculum sp.]HJJ33247.1 methyltransferase [Methanocorpusculum sp.]HJJ44474.1 methyltransferase [Methanocorpusculum sp.]HJJ58977.1 methyltransferase [Methanocorpusculum sp.]HJJ60241.1 methyltransferase [Methanocorpusculum sp.]